MALVTDQVIAAIVLTSGSLITTFGVIYVKNRLTLRKQPKSDVETVFDGYEKLLNRQQNEDARKNALIKELEDTISQQRATIQELQTKNYNQEILIQQLKSEVERSKSKTQESLDQLDSMKKTYKLLRNKE